MSHKIVYDVPTIDTAIYAAGDALGGLLEFENVCTPYSTAARIRKALLKDNSGLNQLIWLALFNRAFTPTADQAAFTVSDADLVNLVAVLRFEVADYAVFANNSIAMLGFDALNVGIPIVLVDGGTSLFGQLFLGAAMTPTYTAADDIRVELVIEN